MNDAFYYRRAYRGPLRAVLLDWAGTTMDFGCFAPTVVFIEVFKRKGVSISMEEAREPMGAHKKTHIRQITRIPSVVRKWEAVFGRLPNETDVEEMFAEFVPLQLACLKDYADLIPGCLEAVREIRMRGLKIGSTTGYTREMMDLLIAEAKRRGYEPDVTVCASDVPEGRPAPWMCLENARLLQIYPMASIVKVDDTVPGVEEGLNAGMWTIGLAISGNEVGHSVEEIASWSAQERDYRFGRARKRFRQVGCPYVVDDIRGVPECLEDITERLRRGEQP